MKLKLYIASGSNPPTEKILGVRLTQIAVFWVVWWIGFNSGVTSYLDNKVEGS
jgi:hypothetical protein